jgi:hypothetical protein
MKALTAEPARSPDVGAREQVEGSAPPVTPLFMISSPVVAFSFTLPAKICPKSPMLPPAVMSIAPPFRFRVPPPVMLPAALAVNAKVPELDTILALKPMFRPALSVSPAAHCAFLLMPALKLMSRSAVSVKVLLSVRLIAWLTWMSPLPPAVPMVAVDFKIAAAQGRLDRCSRHVARGGIVKSLGSISHFRCCRPRPMW